MRSARKFLMVVLLLAAVRGVSATAGVYNLKVVTDASPDFSDMESMLHSITANWQTPEEKCWAIFYWNHIARRQTAPMILHGMALTDPIRQFNDYGYTMCSTISGINCSIWDALGLKAKYWDISNHTVAEVEYDGRWHMYDNSLSALYTLCDGKTLAGVADIGKDGACVLSGGKAEPGHIAKYHCLTSTSTRGFLTGADTIRSLDEEYRCFNPNGLKYRSYFYDWDRGHRYILNLRDGESYTRNYYSLGNSPEYYVPNHGKDPEAANTRYHIRGNGIRTFKPDLSSTKLISSAQSMANITALRDGGITPTEPGKQGEIVFKIEGANVITALKIRSKVLRRNATDIARISLSTVNGLVWRDVWQSNSTDEEKINLSFVDEVNGTYEVLVKFTLLARGGSGDVRLRDLEFETVTMLNSKTQPRLLLGKNTVYVGAGEQSESIVLWPDLQGREYKPYVIDEHNIATAPEHPGYLAVMHAVRANEPAHIVFKVDAPREITRFEYGGRFYNRAPKSQIDLAHSFDGGKTWTRTYSLTNISQPWDVIHYETVNEVPRNARSILFKYAFHSSAAGPSACGLYAVRMEVNHKTDDAPQPLDVTFRWKERQADYSLIERSHTELVKKLPYRYTINVGGADHPVVQSLGVAAASASAKYGYSDANDVGGEKFVSRWVRYGTNLARGKPYKVSVPSNDQWGAGDPTGDKLTDGIIGPAYPGGTAPRSALCWNKGVQPEITVDLENPQRCGAFRIQLGAGYPWWDALKGQIKDRVELLTSLDGEHFESHGLFDVNLRWKDLPANHMWPDEEVIAAHPFELIPPTPVQARYVRYRITPERALTVSEVEVFDAINYQPFDLRIALPVTTQVTRRETAR